MAAAVAGWDRERSCGGSALHGSSVRGLRCALVLALGACRCREWARAGDAASTRCRGCACAFVTYENRECLFRKKVVSNATKHMGHT